MSHEVDRAHTYNLGIPLNGIHSSGKLTYAQENKHKNVLCNFVMSEKGENLNVHSWGN